MRYRRETSAQKLSDTWVYSGLQVPRNQMPIIIWLLSKCMNPSMDIYRQGLAPKPLTPEKLWKFDVATVSANLPSAFGDPVSVSGTCHLPSLFPHGWHLQKRSAFPRATIFHCRSMAKPVANDMPFIAGYIRVFDLWTRGEKLQLGPARQR